MEPRTKVDLGRAGEMGGTNESLEMKRDGVEELIWGEVTGLASS
jgi:hypothetical protein